MTSKLKATNMFIFGGSASVGVEQAGFELGRVLELTDDMHELNAVHWAYNRPDVPIVPPSVWETEEYLKAGIPGGVDYMFANCPCSGLSRINRNASADAATNVHFYRLFDAFNAFKPKAFTVENAPTLVTTGYPIVKDFVKKMKDNYNLTILVDEAGRHGVAMKRARTMLLGWRRDWFDDKIPVVWPKPVPQPTIRDVIGDLPTNVRMSNVPNHNELTSIDYVEKLPEALKIATEERCTYLIAIHRLVKRQPEVMDRLDERGKRSIGRLIQKIDDGTLKWDKSAAPVRWDGTAPSMTSLTRLIHPSGTRQFSVREQARLMGYPDDFVFRDDGKLNVVQCLAQGVPAPFVQWVAEECKGAIERDGRPMVGSRSDGTVAVFQNNRLGKMARMTEADFDRIDELKIERLSDISQEMPREGAQIEFV